MATTARFWPTAEASRAAAFDPPETLQSIETSRSGLKKQTYDYHQEKSLRRGQKPLTAPKAPKAEGLELVGTRPYVQQLLCRVRI